MALFGCDNHFEREDIHGLWELKDVNVDALNRTFQPTLLHIRPNLTYSVSMVSGDFSGIYQLRRSKLSFDAARHPWFRTSWRIEYFPDHIKLRGVDYPYRGTTLRLEKIEEVPDYRSFEEKVLGEWELYKMRTNEDTERLENTKFSINSAGRYAIADDERVLDQGHAIINTRHHKIVFVKDSIQWDVWFYGREMRLENDKLGIQYSLRKSD